MKRILSLLFFLISGLTLCANNSNTSVADVNAEAILESFAKMQQQIVSGEFNDPFFDTPKIETQIKFDPSEFNYSTYPSMKYGKTADLYTFTFIAPGFKRDNLTINLKNNSLVVSGKTNTQNSSRSETIDLSEQIARNFSKTIPLPGDSITSEISAKYESGVLTITVPRNKKLNPDSSKSIQIN